MGEENEEAALNGTIILFIVMVLTIFVYIIYFSNYVVKRNGTLGGGGLFNF